MEGKGLLFVEVVRNLPDISQNHDTKLNLIRYEHFILAKS